MIGYQVRVLVVASRLVPIQLSKLFFNSIQIGISKVKRGLCDGQAYPACLTHS